MLQISVTLCNIMYPSKEFWIKDPVRNARPSKLPNKNSLYYPILLWFLHIPYTFQNSTFFSMLLRLRFLSFLLKDQYFCYVEISSAGLREEQNKNSHMWNIENELTRTGGQKLNEKLEKNNCLYFLVKIFSSLDGRFKLL